MLETVIFTQRVEVVESYNERRDCADQRIARFIRTCGFLPLPVPNNPEICREILDEIKPVGIILTGGNSLVKYGGNAPERDGTDRLLIELSVARRIPLYGFCRGMQSVLDFFGNTLVKVKDHAAVRHDISGLEIITEVNSYHNEGCIELRNKELIPVMRTKDGVIEMARHKSLPILGTMWHPEREEPFREMDVELLKKLFPR